MIGTNPNKDVLMEVCFFKFNGDEGTNPDACQQFMVFS